MALGRGFWQWLTGRTGTPPEARPRPAVLQRVSSPETPPEAAPGEPVPTLTQEALAARFHRYVLDLPPAAQTAPSEAEQATLRRLETITARFDARSLPRLPSILPQLLRMLRSDDSAGSQLATLIGRDPVLVGEVLRIAGSAHYRTAQPIHSLRHAVVLLGQEGLRRVATQHVMRPILQASAGMHAHLAGQRLWDHADRCAHASAWLGRQVGCEPFEAYLAGMTCNAGTGAVVRLLDQEAPPSLAPYSDAFLAACMQLGAAVSLRAAEYWELPATVTGALDERCRASQQPPASPLGLALCAADLLAMGQVLSERGLIDPDTEIEAPWPEVFGPAVILRCRQDLARQFHGQGIKP